VLQLGRSLGDRLAGSFEEVFRAECLLHEGVYSEAEGELARLSREAEPTEVREMARARLAFLKALTSRRREVPVVEGTTGLRPPEPTIPFLAAWNELYLGWARSLEGACGEALLLLDSAERYFRQHGQEPGASLAAWARAEAHFLAGDPGRAGEILGSQSRPPHRLVAVLKPLLGARLWLERQGEAEALSRCGDLLAEAGAALAGSSLPEWSLRLDGLRSTLRLLAHAPEVRGEADGGASSAMERRRKDLAREIPEADRHSYLSSSHWKAWTAPGSCHRARRRVPSRRPSASGRAPGTLPGGDPSRTRTLSLDGAGTAGPRAGLVTRSPGMRALAASLDQLRQTELNVVICGETGSGKEMVARILHAESRRSAGPFLVVDAATLPTTLFEVELFGARAGAFTDLKRDREGILMQAAGGTVLLDEIGGITPEVQGKLLRVLSERAMRPVGADRPVPIDVRFLFSTSRDLGVEAREGRLRHELLHRIQVVTVRVPPLRERREDLGELVDLFLREGSGPTPRLRPGFLERLKDFAWPGNVRELKNLITRLRFEAPRQISPRVLEQERSERPATVFPLPLLSQGSLSSLKDQLERDYLIHHLARLGGDIAALSRHLGVTRKHVYRRCRQLEIRLRRGGKSGDRKPRR
jgi:DNA-binding NtrC family response regulator